MKKSTNDKTDSTRKQATPSPSSEITYICSGGIDSTLIPVGTEEEAKKLAERVLAIVERRSRNTTSSEGASSG